jgi:hypothetical protein
MDTTVTTSLSPFYLLNSLEIWGVTYFLTCTNGFTTEENLYWHFNYKFIAWFIISPLFWSSSSENHQ